MSERAPVIVWREVVRAHTGLTWRGKCAGYTLSTYMDAETLDARPSRPTIAAGMGATSRNTADRGVEELERVGLITVERSRGRSSHRYRGLLPTGHVVVGSTGQDVNRSAGATDHDETATDHESPSNRSPRGREVEELEEIEGLSSTEENLERLRALEKSIGFRGPSEAAA